MTDRERRRNTMGKQYVDFEIGKQKHIALVAHDGKKKEMVDWCDKNKDILKNHFLCGTGTTARLIAEKTGLPVRAYNSGPSRRGSADRCQDRRGRHRLYGLFCGTRWKHSRMTRMSRRSFGLRSSMIFRWPIILPLRISCLRPGI